MIVKVLVAGIDVGSVATKIALLENETIHSKTIPTGWSPREAGETALNQLLGEKGWERSRLSCVVGTGYGRIALPFADRTVTEITCHGRGAAWLFSGAELVLDVGGQDSKAIRIDGKGKVLNFAMNDKCAAGTGRFLQVTASALGRDVSELSELAVKNSPRALNSMCAVFAESEVIGLLASGVPQGEIIAGLHLSIARRLASMVQRLGAAQQIVFTGGVARNDSLRLALEEVLKTPVVAPDYGQLAGAIGAALIARDMAAN